MTAQPTGAVADRADEPRGTVPHDEGAALSTVEDGEAIALPPVGGLLRGVVVTLLQVRPVSREATRLSADCARLVRGTQEHLPSPKDERSADPAWSSNRVHRRVSGTSVLHGHVAHDVRHNGGMLTQTDRSAVVVHVLDRVQ